jgi:hypothetical protein
MKNFNYLWTSLFILLGGTFLAGFVPNFVRQLQASRFTEAIQGVETISKNAITYADGKAPLEAFPPSAPLTPKQVPKGERVEDPPGTWDHLTWAALDFRMEHEHYFSFAFDSKNSESHSYFAARAHGDLDGDGEHSTFEIRGEISTGQKPKILPGLYVEREVELEKRNHVNSSVFALPRLGVSG